MKKRGMIFGIAAISLILINISRFVSAATYGSYTNFSFSQLLSNLDPSLIILPCLFFIFFAITFFSLSKFMFRDNRAIAGVVSICVSILLTYGLNSLTDVNVVVTGWGIDLSGMGWIIPIVLLLFVIMVARIPTKKGRFGLGKTLIILGVLLIGLSFTNLIYEKGALVGIAVFLIFLGLIIALRKKFKMRGNWEKGTLPPRFQRGRGKRRTTNTGGQSPKATAGTLTINVTPSNSEIIIHGVKRSRGSSVETLPAGKYTITAKHHGYHPKTERVRVRKRRNTSLWISLVPGSSGGSGGQQGGSQQPPLTPQGRNAPSVQESMGNLKKRLQDMRKINSKTEEELRAELQRLRMDYDRLKKEDPNNADLHKIGRDIVRVRREIHKLRSVKSPEQEEEVQREVAVVENQVAQDITNVENRAAQDVNQAIATESKIQRKERIREEKMKQRALKAANRSPRGNSSLNMSPEDRVQMSRNWKEAQKIRSEYEKIQREYMQLNERVYHASGNERIQIENRMRTLTNQAKKLQNKLSKLGFT